MTTPSRHQRYIVGLFVLIAAMTGASAAAPQEKGAAPVKHLRVLFVGNSQIYYNDLPRMVEALSESAPEDRPRIRADRFVAGGASLESLWNRGAGKGTPRAKIAEEKWDYVVLQELFNAKPESFKKYAPLFHELIRRNGSRTVLFCTGSISQLYPKGFEELHDMHVAMGKELKVPVAAAGKAWLSYWGDKPTPEQRLALYDPDKAHPGKKGSYIYACTLYAALTGHSPLGLTHVIPKQPADTVTPAGAKMFQEAAWRVHQEINRNEPARHHNRWCASQQGMAATVMTGFGRNVIARMNELGIIIDTGHASDESAEAIVAASVKPINDSHTTSRDLVPLSRGLRDKTLQLLARSGGVVGVHFAEQFLTPGVWKRKYANESGPKPQWQYNRQVLSQTKDPEERIRLRNDKEAQEKFYRDHGLPPESARPKIRAAKISDLANVVDYLVRLVGIDHVGIGGDVNGIDDDQWPEGMDHAGQIPHLTAELLCRGYTEEQLRKLWSDNWRRVFAKGLPS